MQHKLAEHLLVGHRICKTVFQVGTWTNAPFSKRVVACSSMKEAFFFKEKEGETYYSRKSKVTKAQSHKNIPENEVLLLVRYYLTKD